MESRRSRGDPFRQQERQNHQRDREEQRCDSERAMSTHTRLHESDLITLRRVVIRREPSLVGVVESLQHRSLTDGERERLREVLVDEFMEAGIGENDEPNAQGLAIEDLIDKVNHL
jgi:hypothetical protein